MFGDTSSCHNWKGNLLLASSGPGPRLLLNIPQCTGQPPATQNYPAATVNSSAKMEKPPRKGESHDLPMLFHLEKSQPSNKQKEELISSLLIQTLLKGHWLPGILNKTPNLSARVFRDHNFCSCGKTAQWSWSVFFSFLFFFPSHSIPPITSWIVIKMN